MSRLSLYGSSAAVAASVPQPSRYDEAKRLALFWVDVTDQIEMCTQALRANPTRVVLDTTEMRRIVKSTLLQDYLILNHENAGYTHADFLWVAWAHLLCTGSLQHRGDVTREFAKHVFARVSLSIAEFPYRKFETNDKSALERIRDEFMVLEWDCARVIVYYCSRSEELEPFHVNGLIQSALPLDADDDTAKGNDEFTDEEQQYMASKEFQKALLKEHAKTKEELDKEWKEELKQSKEAFLARLHNVSAFIPEKWIDSVFVARCTRLFTWVEVHLGLLLGPRVDLRLTDKHPALADTLSVSAKVSQWIREQSETAVFEKLRPQACNLLYILHCPPGAREHNMRRKIDASWYSITDWNVFISDVDKVYAQGVSNRMSDHHKKILEEEPEDSPYRLAWTLRFFCVPMEAFSSYDLLHRGCIVLSNALMYFRKYLNSNRPPGINTRRSPVIVQCLNRFWVQEALLDATADGKTHRMWRCDNVMEAMYLWVYLIFTEYGGHLDNSMPLNVKYKKLL
jgi:hypothetical protein